MKDRRCTDFLFTVLFLAFVVVFGWVCNQGFQNGKPLTLLSPVDFDGKLCGVDYPDHPFLYFIITPDKNTPLPDIDIEYRAICIKECPKLNTTAPIDCSLITGLEKKTCDEQIDLTTGQPTYGFVGYGTKSILNKLCLPDLD